MGLKSRNKGKRGEREAVSFLKSIGFEDARRTQQYNGDGDSDVVCPESLPHVHIEVKYGYNRHEFDLGTARFKDAVTQATEDCPEHMVPVVLWRPRGNSIWRMTYPTLGVDGLYTFPTVDAPLDIKETLDYLERLAKEEAEASE